jgi:hypothetical protein
VRYNDIVGIHWRWEGSLVIVLQAKIIKELCSWGPVGLKIPHFVELRMVAALDEPRV